MILLEILIALAPVFASISFAFMLKNKDTSKVK